MHQTIRLNRYLALCGIASRRKSEAFIKAGRVKVNGKLVNDLATIINPDTDSITLDNITYKPVEQFVYILLNKPEGVVTSAADEHQRKTVIDLIPISTRIFPVGRLDMDAEGVLLLTNDGELAYYLTHPKFEIKKTYIARLNKAFSKEDLNKFATGIQLEDGMTAPCEVRIMGNEKTSQRIKITLHEGRKRQVKRMFQALGYRVRKLRRISFAGLSVREIKPGEWRYLTDHELSRLQKLRHERLTAIKKRKLIRDHRN